MTGGTNGILVDSLRRFQPFTPSFIGRAEDQAYLLSTFGRPNRLGYLHASGLIMRHDKEGFAQEAIAMAEVGKQIGDYLRILMFSAYAEALPLDIREIKNITDPFTGCFISKLPITVTLLRFSLRVATLFNEDRSPGSNRVHAHRHSSVAGRAGLNTGEAQCAPTRFINVSSKVGDFSTPAWQR